ncbi:hypothetical protein Droror1_Dr00011033 [Drosera rotundifolia]
MAPSTPPPPPTSITAAGQREGGDNSSRSGWVSFSHSPMEMLHHHLHHQSSAPPSAATSHHPPSNFFLDNFYANEWLHLNTQQAALMYSDSSPPPHVTETDNHVTQPPPQTPALKLEDFLGGDDAALVRYHGGGGNQASASSADPFYEHSSAAYYNANNYQHLQRWEDEERNAAVTIAAAPGSEVEEVSSVAAMASGGDFVMDLGNNRELGFGNCVAGGALSLAVTAGDGRDNGRSEAEMTAAAEEEGGGGGGVRKVMSDHHTFGQRTSIFRGVTRHRWTGRYEAHLWDNSCRREGQARKGRQGGYDKEDKAARAYDLAALKYWGPTATTNFPISNYGKELEDMKHMTKQEFIASIRRKSSGFSRGASIYRGVTRHHQQGRWQARIGRVAGNKDLYLGTFGMSPNICKIYTKL